VRSLGSRIRPKAAWWIGAASLAIPLVIVGVGLFRQPLRAEQSIDDAPLTAPTSVEVLGKSIERATTSVMQTHRVTGSLPDLANESAEQPTTTVRFRVPVSVPVALPAWRLGSPVSYASGAIKAKPLPRSVRPLRLRGAVTATATKVAANQFGGSLRPADVDIFFAEYDAPVGEWLGKPESVETEPRSVWFVVFTGMESKRSTGIVRAKDRVLASTTLSLDVTSDVVVVIDDDTGEVLVASEFLSENGGRYTRR
jgi:hypothetical protein